MASNGMTYSKYPTLSAFNDPSIRNDSTWRGGADWFGNLDANSDGIAEPFAFLPRYDGGIRAATIVRNPPGNPLENGFPPTGPQPEYARSLRLLGATLSKLGDAWDTQYDGFPESFVFTDGSTGVTASAAGLGVCGVQFPLDVDLSGIPTARSVVPVIGTSQVIPDPEVCRAVIFSPDGNFSIALPLIAVDNVTKFAVWSEDTNFDGGWNAGEDVNLNGGTGPAPPPVVEIRTLPAQFVNPLSGNVEIGRVLLQTSRTHDYNWLLTVRRGQDGQARGVDVVITHNKSITPDEERLFTSSYAIGSYTVPVIVDGGLKADGELAEPALRKSGYLLDIENARWYRVRAYEEVKNITIGTVTGDGYIVTLETPVIETSAVGKAMFLPGVVDVYPMGSIAIPANL